MRGKLTIRRNLNQARADELTKKQAVAAPRGEAVKLQARPETRSEGSFKHSQEDATFGDGGSRNILSRGVQLQQTVPLGSNGSGVIGIK